MEVELPQKYTSELHESRLNLAPKTKTPGCFGTRSAKIIQVGSHDLYVVAVIIFVALMYLTCTVSIWLQISYYHYSKLAIPMLWISCLGKW